MAIAYPNLIQSCDSDIRSGRPQDVSHRLKDLTLTAVPREWRLPLANVCRRAGLYTTGLKLLKRLVLSNKSKSGETASAAEHAGYAMLLFRSGAALEAIERLSHIDSVEVPEVLLYRAWAHFSRWEYRASIPLLQKYLLTNLSPYARLVGMTNLAFAYSEVRESEAALQLLSENVRISRQEGNLQLVSTCHALTAQVFTDMSEFAKAREELNLAEKLFPLTQGSDHFDTLKYKLILDGLESRSEAPFNELRELAIKNYKWGAWRDSDFYRLKIAFKRERFVHLYFGTPFPEFRDHMAKEFNDRPTQLTYVYGPKSAPRMDIRTGEIDGSRVASSGNSCLRVFEVLLRDFYQPLNVGGLFSALFPDEHFDISTSPHRVHQNVYRTRNWLRQSKIPVTIESAHGFFSLVLHDKFSIRVPLKRPIVEPFGEVLDKITDLFAGGQVFLARQVQQKLHLPKSTVRLIIQRGIERGVIIRQGDSDRSAAYKIVQLSFDKKAA